MTTITYDSLDKDAFRKVLKERLDLQKQKPASDPIDRIIELSSKVHVCICEEFVEITQWPNERFSARVVIPTADMEKLVSLLAKPYSIIGALG